MPADRPQDAPPHAGRRITPARLALAGVFVASLGWWLWPSAVAGPGSSAEAAASDAAGGIPAFSANVGAPGAEPLSPAQRSAAIAQWSERLQAARATFNSYKKTSEYPFDSRPAAEHLDQLYPNQPVLEDRPLNDGSDEADTSVRIISSQSRVFMASGESVRFTIAALDAEGKPVALRITSARAIGLPGESGAAGSTAPIGFNDQGQAGDAQAGDGTLSATLTPSPGPLADFDGTIRVELAFRAGEKTGRHFFDVIHSPQLPAEWAGGFSDTLKDGSLVLSAPVSVKQAGRYVINARIDDAKGKPLALATFNEPLASGTQTITLTVFGKLIRDAAPAFPLVVRDVDGYLLREQGHPDRALMPRLSGQVKVTAEYPLSSFSNAEWQGEVRDRYLREYGKDVEDAQKQLDALKQSG